MPLTQFEGTLLGMEATMLLLSLIAFIVHLIALIDILQNEFTRSNKIIWFLVVFFLPVAGPILYWIIGTDQKIRKSDVENDVNEEWSPDRRGKSSIGEANSSPPSDHGSKEVGHRTRSAPLFLLLRDADQNVSAEYEGVSGPPFDTKEEYEEWKAERIRQNEQKRR